MDLMTTAKAAEKWNISDRRVRTLCKEGKIEGAVQKGKLYMIPENAQKPADGRVKYNILTDIEGNTLTLKDHLEAVGHRDAFLYVQDIATKDMPISENVIKNIHSLVLINRPEGKGTYRRIPVHIM